jgi:predicted DNA-binding transcriptional regulator AlpA
MIRRRRKVFTAAAPHGQEEHSQATSAHSSLVKMGEALGNAVPQVTGNAADREPPATVALTTREAAHIVGVSAKTLINWRHLKMKTGPPFHKYGPHGPVRYLLSDLIAWQQAHRR